MHHARAMILVLLLPAVLLADDKPKPQATPAERLEAIKKEEKDAEAALRELVFENPRKTPEEEKKLQPLGEKYLAGQANRIDAAIEIAKADPKSEVGLAALEWVLTLRRSYSLPAGATAIDLVLAHHTKNPKVGTIIAWVEEFRFACKGEDAAKAATLIETIAEKNPSKTARGQAFAAIAIEAHLKLAQAQYKNSPDCDKLAADAERAYQVVAKDYADCPRLIGSIDKTLGEWALRNLFSLRHLRVGKVAPDIEGEDLDGVKFKLSDYRGKVVVLDFWGDW
jgi:hypothetical protein